MQTQNIFQDLLVPKDTKLFGLSALTELLGVDAPVRTPCCVANYHVKGSIKTENAWQVYDKRYGQEETFVGHLAFALKNENIDLLVLKRIFQAVPIDEMKQFVEEAPSGIQNRRGWFLFEFLTGQLLNIADAAPNIPFATLLDEKRYFVGREIVSKRHRVKNNLLGTNQLCPVIRKTQMLQAFTKLNLSEKAKEITGKISDQLLARAASFMLLADSRASFEIEGERPPRNRLEYWLKAVKQAGKYPLTVEEIVRLQNILIADKRFIEVGLRQKGVFLGGRDQYQEPLPEFIGAKPNDIPVLMSGLIEANNRMSQSNVDAILQAAAIAFGFVYIHPLEDGNGRLQRYLFHHILADRRFTPPGLVFPVSSVLLERIQEYQKTLQAHSGPLMDYIDWRPTPESNVEVFNDTADLYRFYDCTREAELLYRCVQQTIEQDLPREIDYLIKHDRALQLIINTIDLPNKIAEDFMMFMRQNKIGLPKQRRNKEFKALSDQEISQLEEIVRKVFEDS